MTGYRSRFIPDDLNESEAGDAMKRALAAFLRTQHPAHTAKSVSRDIGCKTETVDAWLRLRAFPTRPAHLASLTLAYGEGWLDAVFGPFLEAQAEHAPTHLFEERRRAEQRLASIDAQLQTHAETRRAVSAPIHRARPSRRRPGEQRLLAI